MKGAAGGVVEKQWMRYEGCSGSVRKAHVNDEITGIGLIGPL